MSPDIPSPKKNRRAADTRLGAVNQGILTPDIQLGRSAPEHPTDYRPTNGFLSPSRIPQRPVPSQSLTSSPLGCSPEGTDSVGGASWGMQINFDSKSGQEVQVRGVKRRSTEEKEENARLRARGGACESCRKKHRKVRMPSLVSRETFRPYNCSPETNSLYSVIIAQVRILLCSLSSYVARSDTYAE